MASDPQLVERLFALLPDTLESKKMFGGQCWMLNGNMCVGVHKEYLIIRVGVDAYETLKDMPDVLPMDITGRPMKGWAKVAPRGAKSDEALKHFVQSAMDFVSTLPEK